MMFLLSIAIICGELGFIAYENHKAKYKSGASVITSMNSNSRRRLQEEEELKCSEFNIQNEEDF